MLWKRKRNKIFSTQGWDRIARIVRTRLGEEGRVDGFLVEEEIADVEMSTRRGQEERGHLLHV